MDRKAGRMGKFIAVTAVLVCIMVFFVTGAVMSHGDRDLKIREEYYREMEDKYVKDVRTYLNQWGLRNSGVMLTRVVDVEGERTYTLTIHHKRIEKLSGEELETLEKELKGMEFEIKGCYFQREFLVA